MALRDLFVEGLAKARESPPTLDVRDEALESLLGARVSEARGAWPGEWLDDHRFVERLAESVGREKDALSALSALHVVDLYVACACAAGNADAMAALDREYLPRLARALASIDPSQAFADEVRQQLREKLFVAGKIGEYTGRGPLQNWLRVTAIRTAFNLRRGSAPRVPAEEAIGVASGALDPELDYLKARCRGEFREAFVAALAQLSTDERNVLRMHHLDGLSLEETAAACRIGRSTAARWLAHARERVLKETHRRLTAKLKLDTREVESMFRLVNSQLDVSFHRYLGERA
jgi:RNA polymerase sigma-70 factor (ECF subfamily)